jgi:hypothetical protein
MKDLQAVKRQRSFDSSHRPVQFTEPGQKSEFVAAKQLGLDRQHVAVASFANAQEIYGQVGIGLRRETKQESFGDDVMNGRLDAHHFAVAKLKVQEGIAGFAVIRFSGLARSFPFLATARAIESGQD